MTRLRKIGLVSLAVLIISVIVSQVAFADYVDASKNNDKLPKQGFFNVEVRTREINTP